MDKVYRQYTQMKPKKKRFNPKADKERWQNSRGSLMVLLRILDTFSINIKHSNESKLGIIGGIFYRSKQVNLYMYRQLNRINDAALQ